MTAPAGRDQVHEAGGEMPVLRAPRADDETAWRGMWAEYCAFYGAPVAENVTEALWARLLEPTGVVRGVIAADAAGTALGFAHYVLHPHTWSENTLCYLEDLFVSPAARGRGVGHALIQHLIATGRESGWGRVYWHTQTDNATARRLYDRFIPADEFVRYTVRL